MDAASYDFPFLADLPKREKGKVAKLWDLVAETRQLVAQEGILLPPVLVANLLGISRQRVYQLCDTGQLRRVYLQDAPFITENSVLEFGRSERKSGRPCSLPTTATQAWSISKASAKEILS